MVSTAHPSVRGLRSARGGEAPTALTTTLTTTTTPAAAPPSLYRDFATHYHPVSRSLTYFSPTGKARLGG